MTIPQWVPITMDRRGSINLPRKYKESHNLDHGTVFYLRTLNEVAILAPFPLLEKATTETSRDLALAAYINQQWDPKITPSLFGHAQEPGAQAPAALGETAAVESLRRLVHMNLKGFIPTPEAIKDSMHLRMGDGFFVEVRLNAEGKPLIVIEPVAHTGSMITTYLEREHARRAAEEHRAAQHQRLKHDIEQMEGRKKQLEKEISRLESNLSSIDPSSSRAPAVNVMAQLLNQKTNANLPFPFPTTAAQPPRPDTPPEEGMTWKYNPAVGWVQVDIVD